jgi:outer membrane protein OmpA-like peptidoglycan-associated protein
MEFHHWTGTATVKKVMRGIAVVVGLLLAMTVMASDAASQEISMSVRLTSTLNVSAAPVGQPITGEVLSPDSFKGDAVKGKVTQAKVSHGTATVEFQIEYIHHGGFDYAVMAKIVSVQNSKGQQNLDEQGQPLRATTVPGKGPKQRKFGGNVGGLAGMPTTSPGDTPNKEDYPPSIRVAGQGSDSALGIGSTLGLSLKSNGLGDLTSLRPNGPVEDPYALPKPADEKPSALPDPTSPSAQPAMKSTAVEFIPGERTIFFDDFSEMGVDGVPVHWAAHDGKFEVRTRDSVPPEMYVADNASLTSAPLTVPANFTFELNWAGGGVMEWNFRNGKTIVLTAVVHADIDAKSASVQIIGADGGTLGSGKITADTSQPIEFCLWAQQRKMGVYLNGQKVIDVNEFQFASINHFDDIEARFRDVVIHSVRVAETAPDFSTTIAASGKFVTHGITFDADSDRLKPESAAVLNVIAAALAKDSNLKLEVDAYTDSAGDSARELEISKRRAQAVVSVLATQFGIDARRLTASGLGAEKLVGSNDTPAGRAENQRLEFVKK